MSLHEDLAEEIDVTGTNLKTIDAGSQLDAGWYKALIEDVHDDAAKQDRTRKFTFRVTKGDFEGAKAFLTLSDPDSAEDLDKAKKSRERRTGMAARLGLIPRDASGVVRYNFADAIGSEVAIKVVKQREKEDRTGKWVETDRTQVDYMGVYLLGDSRVPAELRAGTPGATLLPPPGKPLGRPQAPINPAPAAPPPPAFDPLEGL